MAPGGHTCIFIPSLTVNNVGKDFHMHITAVTDLFTLNEGRTTKHQIGKGYICLPLHDILLLSITSKQINASIRNNQEDYPTYYKSDAMKHDYLNVSISSAILH